MNKTKEIIIVAGLILVGIFISLSQTTVDILATPTGKIFPLVHNYAEDYYAYLSIMRQGFDGRWLATSRLTTENFPPQFISVFLIFLGHSARWLGLTLPVIYTLARISGGIVLLTLTYVLISIVYPSSFLKRISAFILVICGMYFWGFSGTLTVPSLSHLWTELDPLVRFSYIPHHLWSKVFMVLSFILLIFPTQKMIRLLFLGVAVLLMGLSSPVALLTFLPTIFLWAVWEFVQHFLKYKNFQGLAVAPFLVAAIVSLILVFYSRYIETGVFPWNSYTPWEEGVRYPVTIFSYLASLGPNFILFMLAVLLTKRQSRIWMLLVSWGFSGWIMVFGLGPILPIANIRFLEGYQFIPISIAATESLFIITHRFLGSNQKLFRRFIWLALIIFIVYAGVGFLASMNEHLHYLSNDINDQRIYVPAGRIEALKYLNKITTINSVVLAPLEVSTMIPAFTSGRVVAGHALYTYHADEKKRDLANFYSYQDRAAAKNILKRYNVSFVWFGNNYLPSMEFIKSLGLTKIFSNNSATIFKVD